MHSGRGYPQPEDGRWIRLGRLEKLEAAGERPVVTRESESVMNETTVTIVGNVITEPKSRRTVDGTRVVSFRIASNERRFDRSAEEWVDGDRLYVTVTCWRKLANGVAATLSKGDPVMVTGRLYTRGYEVEGQKRSVSEVEAWAVGPDLARCSAELVRVRRAASEDLPATGEPVETPVVPAQSTGSDQSDDQGLDQADERPALAMVGSGSS